ncbi:AAA family ATPase [Mesotoga sp. UBA6090]|uniref:AAA family ATPase n=1 Tax=Mesotoga sp. UBA6090 TaxID=1946860 RepID=UPI0025D646A9|nr:ATP-binding protein [Mesotoga sp. UBA6090]
MLVSHLSVKNWRNFREIDVDLTRRVFLVGPNASGKSNFLDVLRFLRDIAKSGGGLQEALTNRGGISKVRCLSARRSSDVQISITLSDDQRKEEKWRYSLGITRETGGKRLEILTHERVWKDNTLILDRPNEGDKEDPQRLTQTNLEQISANRDFREVSEFLQRVQYLHLVPQFIRFAATFSGYALPGDPFGQTFVKRLAETPEKTRSSRLEKVEELLKKAVPQLKDLSFVVDNMGKPHLEARYEHWRGHGAKQREDQFSDGTLRLIGLLWVILEDNSLLLLEEPELSLHKALIQLLPELMYKLQKSKSRQVLLSTHSMDLLMNKGIALEEVLLLTPSPEGTEVRVATSIDEAATLLEAGMSVGEIVAPHTMPKDIRELEVL